jgi:(1->4)-alpha-D-glucan 1-alpha-D-glucosylmutase
LLGHVKRPSHTPGELAGRLLDQLATLLQQPQRRPAATYRMQFHGGFRFAEARELVPYLDRLGITDLYASPFLRASPSSTHGYDVFDHNALNPEVGDVCDLSGLVSELAGRKMGLMLDMVPNHMGIVGGNPFWQHVLEHGPSSPYACFFDIDWAPVKDELEGQILLPILGDQFGVVLERGELRVSLEQGAFWVSYWEHRLPVAPGQYPLILEHRKAELEERLRSEEGDGGARALVVLEELESIAASLRQLGKSGTGSERLRETAVAKRRIDDLCRRSAAIAQHLHQNVTIFNGTPGEPRSFDLLERLLEDQAYRLAYWRVAGEEINYRRFFDLNSLAAIRMEDADVFQRLHRLVFDLIARGQLTGLRVDHPDGLLRPRDYFRRLQEEFVVASCRSLWEGRPLPGVLLPGPPPAPGSSDGASGGEAGSADGVDWSSLTIRVRQRYQDAHADHPGSPLWRPLYVIAEKILGRGETLPPSWAVHGTTGYDFANVLNGIFVDRENGRALADVYGRFLGAPVHYGELVYKSKKLITGTSMVSEINVLAHRLNKISERHRRTRDFTLNSLRSALVELVAVFPIYRTYIDVDGRVDDRDREYIQWAIARAKARAPALDPSIFDFLADVMLGKGPGSGTESGGSDETQTERLSFTLKLQQLTGPVMAKGIEDTAFYVYNRLISLNEVGGEPELFGTTVDTFHLHNRERHERAPLSLLCTSTHDTKRGEDVRARINVISEVPAEWKLRLGRWHRWNRRFKIDVNGVLAPDRNEEVQLYQTLIGAWPDLPPDREGWRTFIARMQEYLVKAVKEAKVNTSWFNSDRSYEDAVSRFVGDILGSLLGDEPPVHGGGNGHSHAAAAAGIDETNGWAEEHDGHGGHPFVEDLGTFVRRLQPAGYHNALAQTVLKLVSPGVPDLYQGTELWDRSLVDPDNRRPVDFVHRRALLDDLSTRSEAGPESQRALWQELCSNMADGRIKLYVIWRALELRRLHPELLARGLYEAPPIQGTRAEHLVAVERRLADPEGEPRAGGALLALAPRLMTRLLDDRLLHGPTTSMWQGTRVVLAGEVPGTRWRDRLSGLEVSVDPVPGGAALRVATLLDRYPVALLERLG